MGQAWMDGEEEEEEEEEEEASDIDDRCGGRCVVSLERDKGATVSGAKKE